MSLAEQEKTIVVPALSICDARMVKMLLLFKGAALHSGNIVASHPVAPDSILGIPENFF